MIGIALFVFGILASVAALHVIWAFGKSWPTQDRKALARTVIGVQSEQMPPAGVTLVVAGLIFAVGCLPWVWLSVLPFPISRTLAEVFMWAAVAVFALQVQREALLSAAIVIIMTTSYKNYNKKLQDVE